MRAAQAAWLLWIASACSGGSDAPSDGGASKYSGYVGVRNDRSRGASFSAFAGFSVGGSTCASHPSGGCEVSVCPASIVPPTQWLSAGAIQVSGGSTPVELTSAADGTYLTLMNTTQLFWTGGQSLAFTASGGSVPAFGGSLVAPESATVTTPQASLATIDRARGVTLAWTPFADGALMVDLTGGDPSTTVSCQFAASAGQGTVPASALAELAAGAGGIGAWSCARKQVAAGDWGITLSADEIARGSDGKLYSFNAQYQ